jgi:hypothetical protein
LFRAFVFICDSEGRFGIEISLKLIFESLVSLVEDRNKTVNLLKTVKVIKLSVQIG